jgi:hypothetical protein
VEPYEPPSGILYGALVEERVNFTVLLLKTLETMASSTNLPYLRLRGLAKIHELTEDSAGSTLVNRATS